MRVRSLSTTRRITIPLAVAAALSLLGPVVAAPVHAEPTLPGSGSWGGGDPGKTSYTVTTVLHVTNNSGYPMTLSQDTKAVYGKFDPPPANSLTSGQSTTIFYYSNNFFGGDFLVGYTVDVTHTSNEGGVTCEWRPYTVVGEYKVPIAGSNSVTVTGDLGRISRLNATLTIEGGYHPNAQFAVGPNANVDCY